MQPGALAAKLQVVFGGGKEAKKYYLTQERQK
jgi:hypothetical protein